MNDQEFVANLDDVPLYLCSFGLSFYYIVTYKGIRQKHMPMERAKI